MCGTFEEPPTGLIPWFLETEGNTYATLLHHPLLFKGKPTKCSRGSNRQCVVKIKDHCRHTGSTRDTRETMNMYRSREILLYKHE